MTQNENANLNKDSSKGSLRYKPQFRTYNRHKHEHEHQFARVILNTLVHQNTYHSRYEVMTRYLNFNIITSTSVLHNKIETRNKNIDEHLNKNKYKTLNSNKDNNMKERVFGIRIATDCDTLNKDSGKYLVLAVSSTSTPTKDFIRALLEKSLEYELMKQHIPLNGETSVNKAAKRRLLRLKYVDMLQNVNAGRYQIREAKLK